MLRNLMRLCKITKANDNKGQFAQQQISYLGKTADGGVFLPYGYFANIPPDTLALMLSIQGHADNRALLPIDTKKWTKLAEGETAFYHPTTDAFIIWRSTGDLDIETGVEGSGSVNINGGTTKLGIGGPKIARVGDTVEVTVTSGSSAGTYTGVIKTGGVNTSI